MSKNATLTGVTKGAMYVPVGTQNQYSSSGQQQTMQNQEKAEFITENMGGRTMIGNDNYTPGANPSKMSIPVSK